MSERIVDRAHPDSPADVRRIDQVADRLQARAVDETVQTERELDRARGAARGSQVVDYLFFLVYALLGLRFVLALMGANSGAAFVQFVRGGSDPLFAPFRGVVPSVTLEGGYTVAWPVLVAVAVYSLLHAAINGILRMMAHRKTAI